MKLEKKEVYTRKEVCEMLVAMQVETLKCNGFFAGHVAQTWAVDCMIGKRIEALGELGVRKECDANTGVVKYMWEPSSDERNEKENPNRYDDLYIFIPDENQIIRISEGSGDNLLPEDTAEGYVDYIYYEQYELGNLEGAGWIYIHASCRVYGCGYYSAKESVKQRRASGQRF